MPLSMVLVTVLLLVIMGPATLVGVAVLVAFIPIVERLASIMLRIRQARVKLTDQRVEIVSAMLQGVSRPFSFCFLGKLWRQTQKVSFVCRP